MNNLFGSISGRSNEDSEHWMSVSDLMAGLMMVFLFISIALMRSALIERDKIKDVAVAYQENQVRIYEELLAEFEKDLSRWDAEINKDDLTLSFKSPDVLFGIGSAELKPHFKKVLSDFFPRYHKVLAKYKESINEIRIEGHTSSDWNYLRSEDYAYFKNMQLSQGRTRSVLSYVYNLEKIKSDKLWVKKHVAAVGFSSSRPILNKLGKEDKSLSRRVSFRVITNAETQIRKILEE